MHGTAAVTVPAAAADPGGPGPLGCCLARSYRRRCLRRLAAAAASSSLRPSAVSNSLAGRHDPCTAADSGSSTCCRLRHRGDGDDAAACRSDHTAQFHPGRGTRSNSIVMRKKRSNGDDADDEDVAAAAAAGGAGGGGVKKELKCCCCLCCCCHHRRAPQMW